MVSVSPLSRRNAAMWTLTPAWTKNVAKPVSTSIQKVRVRVACRAVQESSSVALDTGSSAPLLLRLSRYLRQDEAPGLRAVLPAEKVGEQGHTQADYA